MAGHSKWANIKYRKERADAKRGKLFSRAAKEIISAVKMGGSDPQANTRLRTAIQKARAANLPSDSIERNIKKASGADQADYEEMTYELYGHGGVGLVVDVMTDNKNRIASEIRMATHKRGGTVATPGSVRFNFDRKGVLLVAKAGIEEEALFLAVTDAGAEDFEVEKEGYVVTTPPDEFFAVKEAIEALGGEVVQAEQRYLPKVWIECDVEAQKANASLIEWLEGIDDVDAVTHNMYTD